MIVQFHVPEKDAAEEHDSRVHDTVDSSFFPLVVDVYATFTEENCSPRCHVPHAQPNVRRKSTVLDRMEDDYADQSPTWPFVGVHLNYIKLNVENTGHP